jgi:hypothetical protein
MKIIRNNLIPFPGYKAINLFGVIFARKKANITDVTLNHEAIHTAQMKEMLYIPFYLTYLIESIFKKYRNISFEKEAYEHENDFEYLNNRKHYAQWRKRQS